MRLLAVDGYIDFECRGGDCPISCCGGGWGITIDDDSYKYYMTVEGEFGDKLRKNITRMNDANAFRLDPISRDCAFLNEKKLCDIYRNLGSDALCETCRTYPRVFYRVGDIEFCYLANSCPEVNRMIMQRKIPFNFLFDDSEDDTVVEDNLDVQDFRYALRSLTVGIHILQNIKFVLRDRLILLLLFVSRFQELLIEKKNPSRFLEVFSDDSIYAGFVENELYSVKDKISKIHAFLVVFRFMLLDSYDHPIWKRCIKLAEEIKCNRINDVKRLETMFIVTETDEIQEELEQIMTYRFFAVFMQGYRKKDYLNKLAYEYVMYAALNSYVALSEYGKEGGCSQEDRVIFISLFGRMEHANKRKKDFINAIKHEGLDTVEKLFMLVS